MNPQQKTESANPAAATPPEAADVRDGLGETVASSDTTRAAERIRALEVLAQCMLDAGLGG